MDTKPVKFLYLCGGAIFALIVLVLINLACIYFLEYSVILKARGADSTRDLYYVCSLLAQLVAVCLGAAYFYMNMAYDHAKVISSRRNELLISLVEEFKDIREYTSDFFYGDFADDKSLKKFKDSVIERFSTLSVFVEKSESIFVFDDSEYESLIKPHSIIETNHLFSISSTDELKKHDLSLLKSQFSSSINEAMSVCWSGLK